MIDHISLRVNNLQKSRDFFAVSLVPLGLQVIYDISDVAKMGIAGCSFGENNETRLWLDGTGTKDTNHIAFAAKDHQAVDEFYAAAVAAGGKENGAPGIREQYSPTYYAAFVLDPDGNNIEVVCRT